MAGFVSIIMLGFVLVMWQTNQSASDRVQSSMETAMQQTPLKIEDMSQRTNNSETKTLRITSLKDFADTYFKIYNENSGPSKYNQNATNTMFNFNIADSADIKAPAGQDYSDVKTIDVVVKKGAITAIQASGKPKVTDKAVIATMMTVDKTSVNIKMVKVHASNIYGQDYDATTVLSLKKTPVANPVVNKLDDLYVKQGILASDAVFMADVQIMNSIGTPIPNSQISYKIMDSSKKEVPKTTKLTGDSYTITYSTKDTNSGNSLTVDRKVIVDQNNPLIVSANNITIYAGQPTLFGVTAYQMPNGVNGSRGKDITSLVVQSGVTANKVGSFTQTLTVIDPDTNKKSTMTRKVIVLENQPVFSVGSNNIGTYRLNSTVPSIGTLMAGVSVESPYDGVLNNSVKIDLSKVNFGVAGSYPVKYSVTATGGLSASIERTITIK